VKHGCPINQDQIIHLQTDESFEAV